MNETSDYTLDAHDEVSGRLMYFTDFVSAGDEVALYRNPDEERGFLGMRIVYRDGHGDWYLRVLTAAENDERTTRILGVRP